MRYEDILHQKQTLITDNFPKYVNSYVFGEDMMYNRYTNLMVDYQKEVEKFWNVIKSLKKVIGGGSSTNKDVDPSPSSL